MAELTEREFYQQVNLFREEIGKKSFWERPKEQRDAFFFGLGFAYMTVIPNEGGNPSHEQIEKWTAIFTACQIDYSRREIYMDLGIWNLM